jgi:hypothetical protein
VAVNDPIRSESDAFVAFIDETDQSGLNPVCVETHDGVAIAFYRRPAVATTERPSTLAVVLDEEAPGQWEALVAAEIEPGFGALHRSPVETR